MLVSEIMNTSVVTSAPGETASAAWTRMRRRRIRHLVVMDDSRLVGILTERDLGGRAGSGARRGRTVRSMMTPSVVSAEPTLTVRDAADLMRERLIGCLPVLDGNRLVGIVTATDVFDALGSMPPGSTTTGPRSRVEELLLRSRASSKRLGGSPVPRRRATTTAPRRARPSRSSSREPLPEELPKASKRELGRTDAPLTPAHIRALGLEVDQETRDRFREKLGRKLGRYATSIERITVRLRDVNGPRGGVDQSCRMKVVLIGLPSVVFEARGATVGAAFDRALAGAERAVRKSVQQRRTKPIKEMSREEVAFPAPLSSP